MKTTEAPAIYLGEVGDCVPTMHLRFKGLLTVQKLQQAWVDRRTGKVEWRNVTEES